MKNHRIVCYLSAPGREAIELESREAVDVSHMLMSVASREFGTLRHDDVRRTRAFDGRLMLVLSFMRTEDAIALVESQNDRNSIWKNPDIVDWHGFIFEKFDYGAVSCVVVVVCALSGWSFARRRVRVCFAVDSRTQRSHVCGARVMHCSGEQCALGRQCGV